MSVGWDVKWCAVSRITSPLSRKRPFHWITMKSRLARAARETSKFQNWAHLTISRRRFIAEILPIRRKMLSNQSSIFYMVSDVKTSSNWTCEFKRAFVIFVFPWAYTFYTFSLSSELVQFDLHLTHIQNIFLIVSHTILQGGK